MLAHSSTTSAACAEPANAIAATTIAIIFRFMK
jgi:hypothetical protein